MRPDPERPDDAAADPPAGRSQLAEVRLRGLIEIAAVLGATHRFGDVVRLSAAAARAALEAATVSIGQVVRERGTLRVLVHSGDLPAAVEPYPADETWPIDELPVLSPPGDEARGEYDLHAVDDPRASPAATAVLRRLGGASGLVVPIVLEGRVWGALYATRGPAQAAFTAADAGFARAVAAQIAAGLAQATHLERANRLAYADPLTGLGNRRAFDQRLDAAMEAHRADGRVVTVVLCDVNGLKRVNDAQGHDAGDELILAVADLVSVASAGLPGSFAARIGGDEFCIVAEGVGSAEAEAAATRLCADAAALPGGRGVACGLASTADPVGHVDTPKRLLRLADAAQYRAKRSGSRTPVVAGRRLPPETARSLPAVPDIEPGVPERRRTFPRSTSDPAAVLAAGLRALDESGSAGMLARLEVVADEVARRLDAVGWWISRAAPGERLLRTARYSLYRGSSATAAQPDDGHVLYNLDDYPWSAAAVAGGGYALETGAPRNDPAEDALLVASGYTGAVAAGVTTAEGGWLVEVFTDEISARVEGLAPTMRALVAVAATTA